MTKYGITPKELSKARKLIIKDIKSNYDTEHPIENMTLNIYFDMIKEAILGCVDKNGVVTDQWGGIWNSYIRKQDIRKMTSEEVARAWMDGRGLFSEHANSQLQFDQKHVSWWPNIGFHENNQWYHKDRLDSPSWFKECVFCIGHGGHPTECLLCGGFSPVEYEKDKWQIWIGTFRPCDYYVLKMYIHMKNKNLPVFIYNGIKYLTGKQKENLTC